jgi:eukaryotic-like serine/threonine-protein kinase
MGPVDDEQRDTRGPGIDPTDPDEPEWLRWFDELADLPLRERSARLAGLAGERPELAGKLARLFAAEEEAPQLLASALGERAPGLLAAALDQAPLDQAPDELATGERIGPYRLLGLLGRGGMGEVYRAERADGVFEQQVALKLVKRGMDSEEIVRRFHRERQILARLEHPGIARILDGGTAPDGRPYFVLELIEGEPILAWCRRVGPAVEERLRLVIAACDAVDIAHRNLVVHRDLKPSNLLVTAAGQVKLLDFGIAKLLSPESRQTTVHESSFLTPAYAAPEQILGEPVTTATDVYTLGVILYELLTGRSPHPRDRPLSSLVTQGEGGETVERPSAALRRVSTGDRDADRDADAGISDPRRFARRVQGDLDTVALAALRRDPARRYRSAADLAGDLRRFLAGRPIQARPDSVLYRSRKLVLRHKLATAAVLAAVLSLVAGLAVSRREAEIARLQAQRAERVKEFLLSIFREADMEAAQSDDLTAPQILAAGARRIKTELAAEPAVQAELLDAVAQIDRSLGLFGPATEAAESALAQRRRLFGAASPEAALSLTTLAEVLAYHGQLEEAQRAAEQARPVIAKSFSAESDAGMRLAVVRALIFHLQGKPEEALVLTHEITAAARRRYGPGSTEAARHLVNEAVILSDLSRFDEAEKATRSALTALESSPRASRYEIASARILLAELLTVAGHEEEAAAQLSSVLAMQRGLLGPDHAEVAFTLIKYGYLLNQMRRGPEAERALREAVRILEPLGHYELGSAKRYLGFCLMDQERYAEAEQQFVEVEKFLRAKVGDDNPMVWATLVSEGWARLALGRLDEAARTLSTVVDHNERIAPEGDEIRTALKYLGEVDRRQGRLDLALARHRRAQAIELKLFGTAAHLSVAASDLQIALDLLALGGPERLAEGRRRIDAAITFLRGDSPQHPRLDEALVASGRIALAAGDPARARQDLAEAASRLRDRRGRENARTREAEALLAKARTRTSTRT